LLTIARAFGGQLVKSIGDALLMTFHSPTDAVRCGMAMQNALARARRSTPELAPLHIRVAINVGEVRRERRDVFGEAVNVAARVQALAPADAVYFTEAVYLSMNKAEVPSESLGQHPLKGIPEPVGLYCVPAHRVQRLVAAGDPHVDDTALPYPNVTVPTRRVDAWRRAARAGAESMALRFLPAWRAAAAVTAGIGGPVRWLVVTAACVAVVLALTLWTPVEHVDASLQRGVAGPELPGTEAFLVEGDALLARGDLKGLARSVEQRLAVQPHDGAALLLRGHLQFARRQPMAGLTDYAAALALRPPLADDARLARNLVSLLDDEPQAVRGIATTHPSPALLQRLAWRTGQPGWAGRAQAAALLRELGQSERIDRFGYAVQELEGRSECADRLAAVRELRALKDPRALPHLEKALDRGFTAWFRQSCLRTEAQQAIDELKPKARPS
ncbi:MAG TPA: adenylate/guanylate cyclase domain-containing protein, partial [Solimonas sp.]|nr:adenylate/guanylate cyclase domain-containing protein [Solimonas sp.]